MMIRHLMERLGRAAYTSRVEDAAWLRSLLSTAPDPVWVAQYSTCSASGPTEIAALVAALDATEAR